MRALHLHRLIVHNIYYVQDQTYLDLSKHCNMEKVVKAK